MKKSIYIVLTDTGTVLSRAIGIYTGKDLNHASIAFDEELHEVYSFGRKQPNNPFIGGFVREDVSMGIFEDADCAIYRLDVSQIDYDRMKKKVTQFESNKALYKYNFIGLFGVALHKEIHRERAYFCSQFVATILNENETLQLTTSPCLTMPHDLANLPNAVKVYEGDLQHYLTTKRGTPCSSVNEGSFLKSLAFRLLAMLSW